MNQYISGSMSDPMPEQRLNNSSGTKRNALLLAGGSALAYGLWKRDRIGWPMAVGGALLMVRAATTTSPCNSACQVSYTIGRPAAEIFAFWQDAKNWPLFMRGIKSARLEDGNTVVWVLSENGVEGRSRITQTVPGKLMRWTSMIESRSYECELQLRPAPGNRGTEIQFRIESISPQNSVMQVLRRTSGHSMEQQARESLRMLKQLLEAGEVPTTDGQPHGSRGTKRKSERMMFRENVSEGRRPPRAIEIPSEQREEQRAAS